MQMDSSGSGSHSSTKRAVRPTDLPTENRNRKMRHGECKLVKMQGENFTLHFA